MVVDDRIQVDVARSTLGEQLGDLLLTGQVVQFQAHAGHGVCSSPVTIETISSDHFVSLI